MDHKAILAALTIVIFASCAPQIKEPPVRPVTLETVEKRCQPRRLELDSTGDHMAHIAWDPGCQETRILQGFNIYLGNQPPDSSPPTSTRKRVRPFNPEVYPGDTMGRQDRETYEFKGLENGRRYYAQVRAVYGNGTESPPTNTISFVCYDHSIIELSQSYSENQDGYNFAGREYCRTADLKNDVYFYSKDGKDFLCSAIRVSPVNRDTKIYRLDRGTLADAVAFKPLSTPFDRVDVMPGDLFHLDLADNGCAGISVLEIVGVDRDRQLILEYMYRPPDDSAALGR